MSSTSTHAAIETLCYEDGVLLWGGRKVTAIADEIGRTPFYAYDRQRMTDRVAELRAAMPDTLHLHYAIKANPMPDVVELMLGLVDGLDIASEGELGTALAAGADPANISFAGPGKSEADLAAAVRAEVTINMESEDEMSRIVRIGDKLGKCPSVAIRVNPPFELKTAGMKMGGRPSQFGVDAERVPAMLSELESLNLDFRGFHVFSGAQNLRAEAICESMEKTTELILQLAAKTRLETRFVNLGGGLGIPYFPKERPLVLSDIAPVVQHATERLVDQLGAIEVIMELGRYLVGEAGIYVVRVIEIKESRGERFAICDGGMHHHLAASGNFGQVLRKNYPVVNVENTGDRETMSVVGPLCTPLDLLGDRVELVDVKPGSLIAVLQSGAYGKSASPADFLSHPGCLELLC